jgi:Ca-activated chloride channel family protein
VDRRAKRTFGSTTVIEISWPWVFLCLPLPWLYRRLLPTANAAVKSALRVPSIDDFSIISTPSGTVIGSKLAYWLALIAWFFLLTATARPLWLGEAIEVPVNGRDLMLAIDLSKSMQEVDFIIGDQRVDRLHATKKVVGEFIERRIGDRLGLVLFGTQAYLHVPLTFDRATVRQLLDETVIGLAGPSTAIGDAIGLAVKRLRDNDSAQKVLILVTDGANTAGVIEPLRAAELAAEAGLTIHTVGIGADEIMVRRLFGNYRFNPSKDLDEKTLRGVAQSTGGRYFRAHDATELESIYREIDKLEPIERSGEHFRPQTALYPWPLATSLLLCAVATVSLTRKR